MKKALLFCVLMIPVSVIAKDAVGENSEISSIKSAVMDGYQSQRNLAYGYAHGWGTIGDTDYLPKDSVKACAWRKIIILANKDKVDASDYGNESVDCSGVSAEQNERVWSLVFMGLSFIEKAHSH